MSSWQNIPFFLVWTPLLFASLTAVLKPRVSRFLILLFPALCALFSSILLARVLQSGGAFTFSMGVFGAPFGNELRAGPLEALLAVAFSTIMLLSLLGGWNRMNVQIPPQRLGLYCVMVMLLLSAMMAEIFTNDMFTAYVFIEIMTISACSLIVARTRGRTLFAATKYMIFNQLGSGLFLLGLAMLYCMTGHLLMGSLHEKVAALVADGSHMDSLTLAVALVTVGLAVKSALFPFHSWLPDAYASCTPASSAMLSSLISKCYIFLYIKFVVRVIGLENLDALHVRPILLGCAIASILMGSIDAILEKKLRRMIAFSSVAQIGYIYLGIAVGTEEGIAAAVFHMIAHALAKSLLFLTGDRMIGASDGDAHFQELRGAAFRAPVCGAAFTVGSLSIVGVPLFAGFASKLYLSRACLGLSTRWAVIGLGVLAISTALNAAYFIVTIITLYRTPPHEYTTHMRHHWYSNAALAALAVLLLAVGLLGSNIYAIIRTGIELLA